MNIDDIVEGKYYAIASKVKGFGKSHFEVIKGLAIRRVNAPKDKKKARVLHVWSYSYPRKTDYWQFEVEIRKNHPKILSRMAKRVMGAWEDYEALLQNSQQELEVIKDLVEDCGVSRDKIIADRAVNPNNPATYALYNLSFDELTKILRGNHHGV